MKQNYVLQLKADMEFMDFFMVKTIAIRVGSNRKKYLDMTLADCTGEISAKKWDISDEELDGINRIQVGDIIKVKAGVTEWNRSEDVEGNEAAARYPDSPRQPGRRSGACRFLQVGAGRFGKHV